MTSGYFVALFTRAWIEIDRQRHADGDRGVALFTRAWIEILTIIGLRTLFLVALFTRAWIEILSRRYTLSEL